MSGARWIALGCFTAALAVALGAFGAHGLESRVGPEELAIWETGVRYHALHAVALVLFGLFRAPASGRRLRGLELPGRRRRLRRHALRDRARRAALAGRDHADRWCGDDRGLGRVRTCGAAPLAGARGAGSLAGRGLERFG